MIADFNSRLVEVQADLYRYAMQLTSDKEDASDLLQETSYRALKYSSRFEVDANFKGWVSTIMKSIHINQYNREQRNPTCRMSEFLLPVSPDDCSHEEVISGYDIGIIRESVGGLSETIRMPFSMYERGYSYLEISDTLGIPIGTVKSRIYNARKELQGKLKSIL